MESDGPLLRRPIPALEGVVDYQGCTITTRSGTGRWAAALLIIGVEIAERFAYYGVSSNLITYLTGPLGQPTAAAAAAVNTWSGWASMLPLVGAVVADSWLGRFRTIVAASLLYLLSLGMLTLSSTVIQSPSCDNVMYFTSCPPAPSQVAFFYFALYLVAFAQGGHKPCVQAFGADQFDQNDPEESILKSSFFNWWYFGMCGGTTITVLILNYVQDNIGWGLGFGIPCIAMGIALIVFLLGCKTYRYYLLEEKSPFTRIARTLATLITNKGATSNASDVSHPTTSNGEEGDAHNLYKQSKLKEDSSAPSYAEAEEGKGVLRLFPIWATCLVHGIIFAQASTFFTKQGSTMDRRIGSSFKVPPAALQSFISGSTVAFIPIYDRILIPTVRKFSKLPSGFTLLQRIGIGMILSVISMVITALVEIKRLKTAREFELIDLPNATIPMSLWWLLPQYILYGISDVFTMIGLQEFFYDQVPDSLRSLGLALYLSIFGIGSFISSFLVSVIDKATRRSGESWFSDNLNRAHLDYFYWLLAGLGALQFIIYLYFARSYVYKKKGTSAN